MIRGCPNCGGSDTVLLHVDSSFESCAGLKVLPWYAFDHVIHPAVCLTCGIIYVDNSTLNIVKANLRKAGKDV